MAPPEIPRRLETSGSTRADRPLPQPPRGIPWGRAVLFSAVFAITYLEIVWSLVPFESWPDVIRYIARFGLSDPYLPIDTANVLGWLTSEVGWAWWINSWLVSGYSVDQALQYTSIISLFIATLALTRKTGRLWVSLLLVNPAVIDLFVSQTRSAFAFSLVILGISFFRLRWAVIISVAASTIHTSMPLVLPPYLITSLERFRPRKNAVVLLLIMIAFGIVFFERAILSEIGDRRSDVTAGVQAGFLFATAWGLIFVAFFSYMTEKISCYGAILTFLIAMFEFSTVFGMYSSRFAAFAAVILPYTIYTDLPDRRSRLIMAITYLVYSLIYFSFWVPQLR